MNLSEALEDVEIAFRQLEFAIKLRSYCELGNIRPQEFDTDHTVILENGNVTILIKAIKDYIDAHNQNPHIFVWTAPVERILAKINKCKEALDALH
ncbi:MAG: hypothetical protein STSR0002_20340 [Smithella sp.]|jgi:hypothetical protein